MLFQVLDRKTGLPVFQTDHPDCVPDSETLALIKKAGYKIKQSASGKLSGSYRDWAKETESPQ